ncbi:carbonic anhydrase [Marinivivus vitaminiproducens]|uniref:carbonic anhydrase n=1 Tax=Marinivivus vitaminiproducens TaxID=3035935 RepID=UPI0027A9EF13|nr:carbonic anhydrase [Geminicoccaceae bacterium SCSIO 64248]
MSLDDLLDGYRAFRSGTWPAARDRYRGLAKAGQHPATLVIGCSDSRVAPQVIFNAGPGELFEIRNVAGLVPPYGPDLRYHGTSAALEYGVRVLKVRQIVVLGHGQCGGIQAMVEGAPDEAKDFVEPWMSIARPVLKPAPPDLEGTDLLRFYEAKVVRLSLTNLMSFPWIAERVEAGTLKLHGFHFAIATGVLARLEGDRLVPVE